MKKHLLISMFLLSLPLSVSALSWAYPFIVWEEKVYEVTNEELPDEVIKERVGEVETEPNQETGRYYGNASNEYAIGTPYHRVQGESVEEVLAVKADSVWKRAIYSHTAPLHPMNYIKEFGYISLALVVGIIVWIAFKRQRSRKRG